MSCLSRHRHVTSGFTCGVQHQGVCSSLFNCCGGWGFHGLDFASACLIELRWDVRPTSWVVLVVRQGELTCWGRPLPWGSTITNRGFTLSSTVFWWEHLDECKEPRFSSRTLLCNKMINVTSAVRGFNVAAYWCRSGCAHYGHLMIFNRNVLPKGKVFLLKFS